MPIHDWTRVDRSLYHNFYLGWVVQISRSLNKGLLEPSHYALIENIRDGRKPSFHELAERDGDVPDVEDCANARHVVDVPPQTSFHDVCTHPEYAEKVITIRHSVLNNVVGAVRILYAETERSRYRLDQFTAWAVEVIRDGLSLLIVDPFPPGPLNPQGIHKVIWDEFTDNDFTLPSGKPLTFASYIAGREPEAFIETIGVGEPLPSMPLFLTPAWHVPVPLEASYQAEWAALPDMFKELFDEAG